MQIYTTLLETFNLQGSQGKIRERIFGARTCKSEERPTKNESNTATLNKPHSHTQKFLAKIMGKASSMESLRKDLQRIDEEGGMVKAKTMSQSTSDIFRFAGNPFIKPSWH